MANRFERYSEGNRFKKFAEPRAAEAEGSQPGSSFSPQDQWRVRTAGAAMSTVPFNLGDEGVAALGGVVSKLTGGSYKQGYESNLAKARRILSEYQAAHPYESAGLGIAGTIPTAMATGGVTTVPRAIGMGAGFGGLGGFGAGQGGFGERAVEGAKGAATGAAVSGVLGLGGKLLSGITPSKNVQTLAREGIPLSTGRILGKGASRFEDKLRSLPIVGGGIANVQEAGKIALNRAVAKRAVQTIGKTLPDDIPAGNPSVDYVYGALSTGYDDVLSRLQAKPTQQFADDLQRIFQTTVEKLPIAQREQFEKIVTSEVRKFGKFGKFGANLKTLPGEELKIIGREFRTWGERLARSPDPNTQILGNALHQTRQAFDRMVARANPTEAPNLKALDRGWAIFSRLSRAAEMGKEGVFTPAQLSSAVRSQSKAVSRHDFARGRALLQDLSNAAVNVMPETIPNSGTADRLLLNLGTLGAAGGAMGGASALGLGAAANPAIAGSIGLLGAGRLAYSRPGQALLRNLLIGQRPQIVSGAGQGLLRMSPYAGALTAYGATAR